MITVKAYAQYRSILNTDALMLDTGSESLTLADVLQQLCARFPALEQYLRLDQEHSFRNHAMILSDGKMLNSLSQAISDGAVLELFPVFIGG